MKRDRDVLLVDDSAIQRRVLGAHLRDLGFRVRVTESGAGALEELVRHRPDVALCDVVMPGMDGFELCRTIKSDPRLEAIPVVLLSSTDVDESDRLLARSAGAVDLVPRRPGFGALVEAVMGSIDGPAPDGAEPGGVLTDLRRTFLREGRRETAALLATDGGPLDVEAGRRVVHRWAGRAGALGFPRIGERARSIESALEAGEVASARTGLRALAGMFRAALGTDEADGPEPATPRPVEPGRLKGRRIALLGFAPAEATRMAGALARAGARGHALEWEDGLPGSEALDVYDLTILSALGRPEASPWIEAAAAGRFEGPLLVVGDTTTLLDDDRGLPPEPLLLAPWDEKALVLRAILAIRDPGSGSAGGRRPGEVREVVIADDDETITVLVEATLRNSGYRCHVAHDGRTALDMARRLRPAAVVVDVNMPGRDGFDVLATLRAERATRDVPVVLLTARQQEVDVIRGFELGASDYVVKPFNPLELAARLSRLAPLP